MTLNEVTNQIYELSEDKVFDGIKFTKKLFYNYVNSSFNYNTKTFISNIKLPDDTWLLVIRKYGKTTDSYDYIIPDDKEHEKILRGVYNV